MHIDKVPRYQQSSNILIKFRDKDLLSACDASLRPIYCMLAIGAALRHPNYWFGSENINKFDPLNGRK